MSAASRSLRARLTPKLRAEALDDHSRGWVLIATAACLLPLLLQLPLRTALVVTAAGALSAGIAWRRRVPAALRLLLAAALIGFVLLQTRFAFGRDTGCAVLAAMLAIKPVELITLRDARSLLGFALFAPFSTFLLDQGPLSLVLGLLGATLALASLLRLSDLESGDQAHSRPAGRRMLAVLRLVGIGLPLALAAFWLFPRIGTPLWGVPERAITRPGLSDEMSPGQFLDIIGDDTPALRVQFQGATPSTSQMYWRGPTLWDFDGRTWKRARGLGELAPAPVRRSNVTWSYTMDLEPTDRRQIVALELPSAAPEGTRLGMDYGLSAARPLSEVTRWRLTASPPVAFQADLPTALRKRALDLPAAFNPRTLALARQWRREADQDARIPAASKDAAIVDRSLAWVRRDFAYTLDTPLPGRNGVDEFLFDEKAGFCEHFSSSFVVLMRAAGIPARVVTGFVGGVRNRYGDYWVVRRADAHAWAEAWLPGRGWVRVDPTAAVAPERIYDTLDDRMGGGFGNGLAPVWDMGDWMRRGWNDVLLGFDAERQQHLLKPLGIDDLDSGQLIGLFATLGGLALAWMLWLATRSEREGDALLRAWHRLGRRYARIGYARHAHEPAGDWARRVGAGHPGDGELSALSARFSDWRYAHHTPGKSRSALRALIKALRRHRP